MDIYGMVAFVIIVQHLVVRIQSQPKMDDISLLQRIHEVVVKRRIGHI